MKSLIPFLLACVVCLAACGAPQIPAATATSLPTQLPEILSPSLAPESATQTATPAASPATQEIATPTLAIFTTPAPFFIPGYQVVPARDPDIHPYVFLYDTSIWQAGNRNVCAGCAFFLEFDRLTSPKCSFRVNPGMEFDGAPPVDSLLGNRVWSLSADSSGKSILYYANWGYGESLNIVASGTDNSQCKADIENVLSDTYYTWEIFAGPVPANYQPAQQPEIPKDYSCASLPSRLHIGDGAHVIVDSLWIRSEPRRSEDTKLLLIYPNSPIQITISNGPICADGLTYWNIIYSGTGLNSGWLAEGDAQDYYLERSTP
jgi:hypothetical protein